MNPTHQPAHIFLQPGEYFAGVAGHRINTFLGSCVSITLWHPTRRVGAMSHFLLPHRGAEHDASAVTPLDGRYGDDAMYLMLRELNKLSVKVAECEGKIFGGGNMFPRLTKTGMTNVGQKNGEAARRLLRLHGIPIVSESLFGVGHRKIIFDVNSGHVWSCQVGLPESIPREMKAAA